ncbi:MAG: alpha/beta fold hydrolase, partial [Stackebrandtia sp.]
MTIADLPVPGATIQFELSGQGPPLLLIPGGAGDAGVFGPMAADLAAHYTVVGMYSRLASPGSAAGGEQSPATHADDAVRLLDGLFDDPVRVFASSSGAITALRLAADRPDRIRLAVLHEPPLVNLLPDAEYARQQLAKVRTVVRATGTAEAMSILAEVMTDRGPAEAPPRVRRFGDWPTDAADSEAEPPTAGMTEVFARLGRLQAAFLEHILVPFATDTPD